METFEIPQFQFLSKVVGRPGVVQRQALMVQTVVAVSVLTVLKTVEVPQLQFIAELVEMPHVQFLKVGLAPVNLHDKFQLHIVMVRSGVRPLSRMIKVWVMKTTFFMEFSATDETSEVLGWRREGGGSLDILCFFRELVSKTTMTIWGGSVLTGEESPLHSKQLNHALSQVGGPNQSQLSRLMSSGPHLHGAPTTKETSRVFLWYQCQQ